MDKGIFYLVCTVLIIAAVVTSSVALNTKISKVCVGKSVVVMVTPTATPTLVVTATPAAVLKPLRVVSPVKPLVK